MSSDIAEVLSPLVSNIENFSLCKQPNEREILRVVKQLGAKKAPGPDGMTASFYQHYWKVVSPSVSRMIWNFFDSGFILKQINFTFIALLPKTHNPTTVTQFRPTALCNVCYKFIAKILANRPKTVLPKLISSM